MRRTPTRLRRNVNSAERTLDSASAFLPATSPAHIRRSHPTAPVGTALEREGGCMSGSFDPRWGDDPRDRYDDDRRDRDEDDGRSAPGGNDPRERGDRYEHELERDHGWDTRDRVPDDRGP